MFRWRDDEDPLAGNELRDAIHGVLQEASLAQQLEELLRPVTPREWPEARPGAAGEHKDVEPGQPYCPK